jgi:hypothetical protein
MRLGGDEFAIIDPSGGDVRGIAERLRAACMQALKVAGGEYVSTHRWAWPYSPPMPTAPKPCCARPMPPCTRPSAPRHLAGHGRTALRADVARYAGDGTGAAQGHTQSRVLPEYQPKIDAASGKLLGFEALARWYRPEVGLVSPVEFIAVAERTGLIGELGASLLERACCQIARWRSELGACVPVAVNVSAAAAGPGFRSCVKGCANRPAYRPKA